MLESTDHEAEESAPIDMLEAYFAAHGWEHERHDEEIVATVKGSWATYELRALWRDDDSVLQFLAFPDIKVTEDRRAGIYEALVATAVGLLVAIPAVIAFNYFQRRVKTLLGEADALTNLVLSLSSGEDGAERR